MITKLHFYAAKLQQFTIQDVQKTEKDVPLCPISKKWDKVGQKNLWLFNIKI